MVMSLWYHREALITLPASESQGVEPSEFTKSNDNVVARRHPFPSNILEELFMFHFQPEHRGL